MSKFAFLSDGPPLRDGGYGNSAVAYSLCVQIQEVFALVLTRRYEKRVPIEAIRSKIKQPVHVYPDCSKVPGLRYLSPVLRSLCDCAIFLLNILTLRTRVKESGVDRLFALCGNDSLFLINAIALSRVTSLPLDLYMVDDIESSAQMVNKPLRGRFLALIERKLLPLVDRVFVISPGYVDHLWDKYKIRAHYLPVPVRHAKIAFNPIPVEQTDRFIGFSGSLNRLYRGPIRSLAKLIVELNAENPDLRLRLLLCTRTDEASIQVMIQSSCPFTVVNPSSNDELIEHLTRCSANFLPYSFESDPAVTTMVSTAFSCKISEYFASGRPIIAFGPSYGSNMQYFSKNELDFSASNEAELKIILSEIGTFNATTLISKYQQIINSDHSGAALSQRILSHLPTTLLDLNS